MIIIAQDLKGNQWVSLKEIAGKINSPVAFTAKILQILSREGLLLSSKGASGGFQLSAPAREINLAHIVIAIDGNGVFTKCGLGLEQCNSLKPCPVHFKFSKVREQLAEMMYNTNLEELSKGLKEGMSYLKV